jgi:hypothetical protein
MRHPSTAASAGILPKIRRILRSLGGGRQDAPYSPVLSFALLGALTLAMTIGH